MPKRPFFIQQETLPGRMPTWAEMEEVARACDAWEARQPAAKRRIEYREQNHLYARAAERKRVFDCGGVE